MAEDLPIVTRGKRKWTRTEPADVNVGAGVWLDDKGEPDPQASDMTLWGRFVQGPHVVGKPFQIWSHEEFPQTADPLWYEKTHAVRSVMVPLLRAWQEKDLLGWTFKYWGGVPPEQLIRDAEGPAEYGQESLVKRQLAIESLERLFIFVPEEAWRKMDLVIGMWHEDW